jgi:hypothetical protein
MIGPLASSDIRQHLSRVQRRFYSRSEQTIYYACNYHVKLPTFASRTRLTLELSSQPTRSSASVALAFVAAICVLTKVWNALALAVSWDMRRSASLNMWAWTFARSRVFPPSVSPLFYSLSIVTCNHFDSIRNAVVKPYESVRGDRSALQKHEICATTM